MSLKLCVYPVGSRQPYARVNVSAIRCFVAVRGSGNTVPKSQMPSSAFRQRAPVLRRSSDSSTRSLAPDSGQALGGLMKGLKDLLLGREEDAETKAGLTGSIRHSVSEARKRRKDQDEFEQYRYMVEELMKPQMWTYGAFKNYQEKVLEASGAHSMRAKFSEESAGIEHIKKGIKVLAAMNPIELASNHRDVFTERSRKLIAEKAGVSKEFVIQVILEHDALRGDRKWYMIRKQYNMPMPKTFEDREFMAKYDRPRSQMERQQFKKMVDKYQLWNRTRWRQPIITAAYKRHKSTGFDRWRKVPVRWFPRWKKNNKGPKPSHMLLR
ncbi:hypothetical protein FOZ61_000083 [Perkinsus olseni]|uniref:Uncharacterized protein n=1 Tax=Perkinsus olseni TaxID=32597 RepID=A0A7J6MKF2_PEROL|nr:hypothetical protein FOZ61_000083 [Perkinsus olseni]KAF4675140.1 hypothetical protein FOL46_002725 [Perkinsus olseni]